jgi:dolichol-phosphate mannosyltransferase
VQYKSGPRGVGASKYTIGRMFRFALDAIVSFSALPLRLAGILGVIASLLGGLYLIYVLIVRFTTGAVAPGWTSILGAVLLMGGLQLLCLGVAGHYLGKMYDEIKRRPLFIVAEDSAADERLGWARSLERGPNARI